MTSFGIYCTILLLVLVGRAAFVFPLSALSNCMSVNAEGQSITFKHQVVFAFSPLNLSMAIRFQTLFFSILIKLGTYSLDLIQRIGPFPPLTKKKC